MSAAHPALPRWDLTSLFPSLRSDEFDQAYKRIASSIRELAQFCDDEGIERTPSVRTDDRTVRILEECITKLGDVLDHVGTVIAYVRAHISTNSHDNLAMAKLSAAQQHLVVLDQVDARFTAWIGALDLDAILPRSAVAREHEYLLRRAQTEATHQMSPQEEALASELNVPGGNAWGRLHADFTSQLTADVETATGVQAMPISAVRNLAFHPDREVRRRAYVGEIAAWTKAAVPLAAAINAVKGEDNVLIARRGWGSALDVALFNNHIDRETLGAMLSAARASFPQFRRYLKAKAKLLNLPILAWYDIEAPVGSVNREWPYDEAKSFIVEQFGSFSPQLRALAERAFRENWIDVEPREGKRGGGFCMSLIGDQSRILVNYVPSFDGLSTVAHELGHAYHNVQLAKRPPLLRVRTTPSTLAETASTFCESIVRRASMRRAGDGDLLALLDASLSGTCQIIVDITSRFLFESRLFETRRQRELSVDELNECMLQAQRETYGDAVDAEQLHPYMWAVKQHYYSSWQSFYNFPYMFGQLFGLGLFAAYSVDPERFLSSYDDFLASTSMADAAELTARFGVDVRSTQFWESSLAIVGEDIDRFVQIVEQR
jgi:oligoendopeptidase F